MNRLNEVLVKIGEAYKENIQKDSRHYLEVSIAQQADEMGYSDVKECYHDVYVIVPLKRPVSGMKVRIDGRTFVNYAQFDSGIVTPQYIANEVTLPHEAYIANDSMICNFN